MAAIFCAKVGTIRGGLNPAEKKRSAIPRHNEIKDILANKICKDLGIPPIK